MSLFFKTGALLLVVHGYDIPADFSGAGRYGFFREDLIEYGSVHYPPINSNTLLAMQKYSKIDQPEILKYIFTQPKNGDSTLPRPDRSEDVVFELTPDIFISCRYYHVALDSPLLLFFPSASATMATFGPQAEKYNRQGISVFLLSYRGQGGNSGKPAVAEMLADGARLFELATEWLKDKGCSGPLFVMGQSLGSVCAIDTLRMNADGVKGLIIESGICETSSYLRASGVPSALTAISEEEGFNVISKIEKIKLPTLIFHGAKDEIVPVAEAEKIQACSGARSKQFFVVPGAGRDNLTETGGELYFQAIKKHIDTVCGINTWRQRRKSLKDNGKS